MHEVEAVGELREESQKAPSQKGNRKREASKYEAQDQRTKRERERERDACTGDEPDVAIQVHTHREQEERRDHAEQSERLRDALVLEPRELIFTHHKQPNEHADREAIEARVEG